MTEAAKRRPPPALRKILEIDAELTNKFVLWANKYAPLRNLRIHYKALEISCHGIPWLAFWIAFTWLFNDESYIQMQVNMVIGLLLDIMVVAVAKAYFRRRRPLANKNDAFVQMGPDMFSFPSGHVSRAVFVACFFTVLQPISVLIMPPLLAWSTAISLSRVLMNRHYILDVLGGALLGLIEASFVGLIWFDDKSAKWLMSFLSDEKLDGGEYHV